jgi:MFS family permease
MRARTAAALAHPLTLPVYVPTMLLAFCAGMLVPTLPLYARSFGVSYGVVGLVLAAEALGMLLGDVPAGILFGRLGMRRSMLVGLGTLAAAVGMMGFARGPWELFAYSFVAGLGMAIWNITRHAYLTDATPSHKRGTAIAVFGGINRIGTFLGPAVGGIIAATFSLRAPFLLYAVLAAAALIFPALYARDDISPRTAHRGGVRGHTLHLWNVLHDNYRTLTPAGMGQLLAQMVRAARKIVVPLFGADILGLSVEQIGWIVSLSSLVDMSLFPVAGAMMDRLGRKYAIVPCFLIQGIAMALIPFTTGYYTFLAATMLIGFGNGLGSGTMMTLGADLAPKDAMGEFLGVWRLIGDAGHTGAPIAVGAVADLVGLVPATFLMGGVGMAAAAVFMLFVPETLHTTRPQPIPDPST